MNELIWRYVDGDLSDQELQEFERYLEETPTMRHEVQKIMELDTDLAQHYNFEAPPNLLQNVLRRVKEHEVIENSAMWGIWFTFLAMILTGAVGYLLPSQESSIIRTVDTSWLLDLINALSMPTLAFSAFSILLLIGMDHLLSRRNVPM
ncbi:MAG: hypothetical protein R3275_11875 [Saprospiraceae bacterium]|nr:hypothetical protein [Saprospiraceae bacterium]